MTIRNALLLAGAFLALTFFVNLASENGYLGEETAKRTVQVAAGLLVVYFANLVPKTLEPLAARCEPSRGQALQRFSGWTLVLGGLGYCLAWLAAPFEQARALSIAVLATSVVLVVARCLWALKLSGRNRPSAEV